MANDEQRHDEHAAEVIERNVAGMRELLDQKAARAARQADEPPLEDDPQVASGEDLSAQDARGSRGSTGGIRNMGGGRS